MGRQVVRDETRFWATRSYVGRFPSTLGPDLRGILAGMFKRQTTGSVVCVSCGYLVGVNDDKCYHCGRRNPDCGGSRRRSAAWDRTSASSPSSRPLRRRLRAHPPACRGPGWASQHVGLPRAESGGAVRVRGQRRVPRLRVRAMVDGAQRGLAARRAVPHSLQPDLDSAAGAGGRRVLTVRAAWSSSTRPAASSDSLLSSVAGQFLTVLPFRGADTHGRRVGADFRPARRAGLLRTAGGLVGHHQSGRGRWRSSCSCSAFSCRGIDNWAHARRLCRRLPGGALAGPAQSGARQPHALGACLPGAVGALDPRSSSPRISASRWSSHRSHAQTRCSHYWRVWRNRSRPDRSARR